jgi:hypothetical protein
MPARPLHPDARRIAERLARHEIRELYHFTDLRNLAGIARVGALCCKNRLAKEGILDSVRTGGNEISLAMNGIKGNVDFLSLYLTPFAPMEYWRKQDRHICFFCLKPEVAGWEGVLFTDWNAAATEHDRAPGLAGVDLIDFEIIRGPTVPSNPQWKRNVQAEILVPDAVPLDMVTRVCFVSKPSRDLAIRNWGSRTHRPPFEVDTWFFANSPGPPAPKVEIPHVQSVVLTTDEISKETYKGKHENVVVVGSGGMGNLTALIGLRVSAGQVGQVRWLPAGKTSNNTFSTSEFYHWWPSISIKDLPVGSNTCEVHLGDNLWTVLDFEVR